MQLYYVTFAVVMVVGDVGVGWCRLSWSWNGSTALLLGGGICPLPLRSHYTVLPLVLLPGNRHCLK